MSTYTHYSPHLVNTHIRRQQAAEASSHTSSSHLALAAVAAAAASVAATTTSTNGSNGHAASGRHDQPQIQFVGGAESDDAEYHYRPQQPPIRRPSSAGSYFEEALKAQQRQQHKISGHRRGMSAERPRVRAEGPGGPDVKQGARIACLDCRSAKIRCSAPTDGKVPCKRCARHGRECVFEKHRRGRKPGRGNNTSSKSGYEYSDSPEHSGHSHGGYDRMSSLYAGSSNNGSPATSSSQEHRDPPVFQTHPGYSSTSSPSYEHGWRSSALNSSDPRISTPPIHGMPSSSYNSHGKGGDDYRQQSSHHRTDGRSHSSYLSNQQSPQLSYNSRDPSQNSPRRREGMGIGLGSGSYSERHGRMDDNNASRRDNGMPHTPYSSMYASPRYTPSSEQAPSYMPTSSASNMPPPLVTTPGARSWLDFPTPGSRSLLSPSHLMSSSMGGMQTVSSAGGTQSGWPGSVVASPHKRKSPGDYFAGVTSHSVRSSKGEDDAQGAGGYGKRVRTDLGDGQDGESDEHAEYDAASTRNDEPTSYEDDEHIDQLDEDMVNAGHEDDVLSTPLRLLAHASDAAASLKSKQDGESTYRSGPRSATLGAATMGLVSPPIPRLPAVRSWLDHKPRLPMLGPYQRAGPGSLLPTLISSAQRRDQQRLASLRSTGTDTAFVQPRRLDHIPAMSSSYSKVAPAGLGTIGRSRSYTPSETKGVAPRSPSPSEKLTDSSGPTASSASTVTRDERRAEILGINVDADGKVVEAVTPMEGLQSITPSTLDHDAWEYRDGRVRARKSVSIGALTSVSGGEESNAKKTSEGESAAQSQKSSEQTAAAILKAEGDASGDASAKPTDLPFSKPRPSVSAGTVPRRWHAVQKRVPIPGVEADADISSTGSDHASDSSEALGAAHRDFFSMSIFHSKMDNEEDLDPVTTGILTLRELEKLFDIFFARINPVLTLFDPFLHSVTYVRARSALLTSVMAALAARMSDTERDAKIAVELEHHWRYNLLPEALLGGYKSVELSQAFAVLSLYHKPTNRLSEDRSWQYLGFAIRIATEIGINRLTQPSLEVKDNEQVGRRMRNRARLWMHLFLADRALSLQTGRQTTLTEDSMIAQSDLWHREPFALPSDARLVSLIKLKRVVTLACQTHDAVVATTHSNVEDQAASVAAIYQWHETIKNLNFARMQANAELDRWQDVWCIESLDESSDGIQTLAIASFLQQWRPRAQIDNLYARLHLNSLNLETIERLHRLMLAACEVARGSAGTDKAADANGNGSAENNDVSDATATPFEAALDEVQKTIDRISLDCWEGSLRMLDIFNTEVDGDLLSAAPNALAIKIIYASLAAVRLSNSGDDSRRPWASRDLVLPKCRLVAERLIKAGRTPQHRNGAAAPFGLYLKGIVSLWESEAGDESVNCGDGEKEAGTAAKPAMSSRTHTGGSSLDAAISGSDNHSAGEVIESALIAAPTAVSAAMSESEPIAAALAPAASSSLQKGLVTPAAAKSASTNAQQQQQQQQQKHTVGDDIWGSSTNRRLRSASSNLTTPGNATEGQARPSDAGEVDRMWDYLTTYTETANSFPLSLWQQQATLGTPSGHHVANSHSGHQGAAAAAAFALADGSPISAAAALDANAVLNSALVPALPVAASTAPTVIGVSAAAPSAASNASSTQDASPANNGSLNLTSVTTM